MNDEENLGIVVTSAKFLRSMPWAESGHMELQNNHTIDWDVTTIELRHGENTVIKGPISAFATIGV